MNVNYRTFFGFKKEPYGSDLALSELLKTPELLAVKELDPLEKELTGRCRRARQEGCQKERSAKDGKPSHGELLVGRG